RWAEDELGQPPCAYAWLVVGSEGRREQTLQTDQDHALVWADGHPDAAPWFERLAARVVADLEAAGFPRCPGDTMATRWKGPLATWLGHFKGWLQEPTPEALLAAATFFDFRQVHGALDLAPLEALVVDAPRHELFLRCLAKAALEHRPRTGLLLRLRGDAARVDLKREGLGPIVMLARCHALEVGSAARGTLERLAAAERAGLIDRDTSTSMAESFAFLTRLRLREQLRRMHAGQALENEVVLGQLTPAERRALKDALRAIREWQDVAAYHFQTSVV
ncbi:MAG: putative nucleotidyltransferase substrate binding domain-containing protein, partial [Myxococcota bacterium]